MKATADNPRDVTNDDYRLYPEDSPFFHIKEEN